MGATSARKAGTITANTQVVIAIECLAAAQGLDLRAPLQPSPATHAARALIRSVSPTLEDDRSLADDINAVTDLIRDGSLVAAVTEKTGELA